MKEEPAERERHLVVTLDDLVHRAARTGEQRISLSCATVTSILAALRAREPAPEQCCAGPMCDYSIGQIPRGPCEKGYGTLRRESAPLDREREALIEYADRYRSHWLDRDEAYWLQRMMQEVGELASVMAGDHDDTVEHELQQIGSIALNWLRRRALAGETPPKEEP